MSAGPLVVEAVRGDVVESRHLVDVAVVAGDGTLVAWAGDSDTVAYLRSSAKPVQASVCIELGWEPPGDPQIAIACASHNGEPFHVDAVRQTLYAAGLHERSLDLLPMAAPSTVGAVPPPGAYGPIYHNCSGKHAAMLATMIANGWDPDSYRDPDTELQQAIRDRIEGLAGRPARAIAADGCGVPTFAFSIQEAARLFARLPDQAARALAAMRAHPLLVAGSNRICTSVMSWVSDVVLKVGAEGLLCGVLLGSRTGFALKARDGSARGREIATLRVLESLGALGHLSPKRILDDVLPRLQPPLVRSPVLRCTGALEQA